MTQEKEHTGLVSSEEVDIVPTEKQQEEEQEETNISTMDGQQQQQAQKRIFATTNANKRSRSRNGAGSGRKKRTKLSETEREQRDKLLLEMEESGEYEHLKSFLYARLILQEEWKPRMDQVAKEKVQQKGGVTKITFDDLSRVLVKTGKNSIPAELEKQMKKMIRKACFKGQRNQIRY